MNIAPTVTLPIRRTQKAADGWHVQELTPDGWYSVSGPHETQALAYRVLGKMAEEPTKRVLDRNEKLSESAIVLQRVSAALGDLAQLWAEVTAPLLADLRNQGLLDENNDLTEKGQEVLKGGNREAQG